MEKKIDSDIKTTPIGILKIQKFRVTGNYLITCIQQNSSIPSPYED